MYNFGLSSSSGIFHVFLYDTSNRIARSSATATAIPGVSMVHSAAATKCVSIRLSTGGSIITNGALKATWVSLVEDMIDRSLVMSAIQNTVGNGRWIETNRIRDFIGV